MEACKWIPQGVSGFHSQQVFTANANLWSLSGSANPFRANNSDPPFGQKNYIDSIDRYGVLRL